MSDQTREYAGHTITLDTEYFRFRVEGLHFPSNERHSYPSYREAQEAIDKRLAQYESQQRERLSLPVLNDQGKPCVITGVHARNATLLGVGETSCVYPQQAFIIAAIAEVRQINSRLEELRKLLWTYSIRYHISAAAHADMIATVKRKYEEATQAAAAYQGILDTVEEVSSNVVTLPTTK